ncbi:MAG: DNA-processing protein DprA [Clostridia bacterium]|nr:DNA-processing protein DprA [Clostridia bacterium]
MEEYIYYVWLSLVAGISSDVKLSLMRLFGGPRALFEAPEGDIIQAFRQVTEGHRFGQGLRRLLERDLLPADRAITRAARSGSHVIPLCSPAYPSLLKTIKDPPIALFGRGDVTLLKTRCVAIVGTRRASPYGRWAAAEIARRLARLGITIVSGMAEGVDSAAHEGCLAADGKTIAVFGTGLDVCFPKSNQGLCGRIAEKGLLLSEYAFEESGRPEYFPVRNRIISGLSESCVVAEGAVRSGSLITAGLAAEQGRNVFALPGNINQPGSAGTNLLISEGVPPITSLGGLIELLGLQDAADEVKAGLSEAESGLLNYVRSCGSTSREYILAGCGMPAADASSLLICLELKGLLKLSGTQVYVQS